MLPVDRAVMIDWLFYWTQQTHDSCSPPALVFNPRTLSLGDLHPSKYIYMISLSCSWLHVEEPVPSPGKSQMSQEWVDQRPAFQSHYFVLGGFFFILLDMAQLKVKEDHSNLSCVVIFWYIWLLFMGYIISGKNHPALVIALLFIAIVF